ncbi:substrate-binding domain-containing protein [Jeongeupia chitinilytica]|uniref:LacI family transcriptional regulator n=1 Tax=Jeongeupia chitinilytica TaxID=1041641 RepID=A0ABQ3H0M4_9NEIS|nr:substrate-binding domain-containing protein [Jeongeupia chitinilytica]GHD64385.1 LacI family transcriptional regulator [Jeongeupia chitinilytica]
MNLRQLAAHLQLSPTTVSRALNGFPEVNQDTRERVVEAAARLGYRPNTVARRLATGKTDSIGIIYPFEPTDLGDPVFLDIIAGVTERLGEAGLDLVIISAAVENELETYHRVVSGGRVDGLIVARTRVDDARLQYLAEKQFPFVAHGRSALAGPYPWFDYDNEAGMRLAVDRLTGEGHRRIALLHAPLEMNFAVQRRLGFLLGLNAAGVDVRPDYLVCGGLDPSAAADATRGLLAQAEPPTAIVVDNNVSAPGVMNALRDAGLVPGRDISVIVFGGLPAHHPDVVSAVLQPEPRKAGRTLAELMLARLNGRPAAELTRLWKPVFVAGDTDAPLPR